MNEETKRVFIITQQIKIRCELDGKSATFSAMTPTVAAENSQALGTVIELISTGVIEDIPVNAMEFDQEEAPAAAPPEEWGPHLSRIVSSYIAALEAAPEESAAESGMEH